MKTREEKAAYQRAWEKANRDKRRAINARLRSKHRAWFKDIKKDMSCSNCGESESACLDFHHICSDTKKRNVANMVSDCFSKEKIEKEMAKCVVVCANCHRKIHAGLLSYKIESCPAAPLL